MTRTIPAARPAAVALAALAAMALAVAPGRVGAANAAPTSAVELLRDFTIALPPGGKTAVRLLVSPLPDDVLDRLGPSAPLFAVGPRDAIWLGIEPGMLIHATKGYRFRSAVPLSDIAVVEGGGLVVAASDAVGYLVPDGSAASPGSAASEAAAFQPIAGLPLSEARLAAGGNGSLYLFGPALEGGGNAVYLMAPEAAGAGPGGPHAVRTLRRVFSTGERIAAVAGDGAETYVATGKLIVKISGASRTMTPVLAHPREPIAGLALTRRGLLFYATATSVGVVSPGGTVEFVKAPHVALRSVGDDLYLLLRSSLAVVKVEGMEPFRLPARPARNGR